MKKLAVVLMRAQLPTEAHFKLIEEAATVAEDVLVVIGSTNRAVDTNNPFSYAYRCEMLRLGLKAHLLPRVQFKGAKDYLYQNFEWASSILTTSRVHLNHIAPKLDWRKADEYIVFVTHRKDDLTSEYIDEFPMWEHHYVDPYYLEDGKTKLSATDERIKFFVNDDIDGIHTPEPVKEYLRNYKDNLRTKHLFELVQRRYQKIAEAKKPYENLPYGIKFFTADPVIMCDGHVLLGMRATGTYGEKQWCIPGGYVEPYEPIMKAMYRELYEETSVDVPDRALRQAFKGERRFEMPGRDERGDFVTFAGLFVLESANDGKLPKVKPQKGELEEVRWFPIADLARIERSMFLDHAFIIEQMRRAYDISGNQL